MNAQPLESVRDLFASFTSYAPTLLAGLLVLVLGLVVAWIASQFVVRLLVLMRLDRVIGRLGWGRAFQKGDVRHSLFELAGRTCGILVFLVFLDNAVTIWQLTVLSRLLERLVLFIPQILLAGAVLLLGSGVATGVSRAVQRALQQEEFERAQLLARLVRAAIMVFTVAIVFIELNIAVTIVTGAFLLVFGALCLAFVLAVGLGSKRAVELMWEERLHHRERSQSGGAEKPAAK
ncbi:MAG TPA: hypothetical protein VHE13_04560 [Opitutus sp.]|nr:hypothetical protein [Opitutus sp.]